MKGKTYHCIKHQEDSQNVLLSVPGGGDTVGGGVRETDDGSGAFVPGAVAGSDSVHRVQGYMTPWLLVGHMHTQHGREVEGMSR